MQNEKMGNLVFALNYANIKADGSRETYQEAVERIKKMHQERFWFYKIDQEIEEAFEFVKQKKVFASQRSLQYGGKPIVKNNLRLYNCAYSNCDRLRFFGEMFYLLLSGVGAGLGLRKQHIEELPNLLSKKDMFERSSREYIVKDSIEEWSDTINDLLESYHNTSKHKLVFDYTQIRPAGSKISSGGRSSGYIDLKNAIDKIEIILQDAIIKDQNQLSSIQCFDICCLLADVVLAGGRRRSALIALFNHDDYNMINAKNGNWFEKHSHRSNANISVAIDPKEATKELVLDVVKRGFEYGEPNLYFTPNECGTNPCGEIGLYPYTFDDKEAGWSMCNLTEINLSKIEDEHEFYDAVKASALIGTLQAHYTNSGYLGESTRKILEQEALLGVSLTGVYDCKFDLDDQVLRRGVEIAKMINTKYAQIIEIKRASRVTTIKPSGTASIIGGTCSGIHPHHAKHYIRRVRISKLDPLYTEIKTKLPRCIDEIKNDNNTSTVMFACSSIGKSKHDINTDQFLNKILQIQKSWVLEGTQKERVKGLTHNVSNTTSIKKDEIESVASFIYEHRFMIKGFALMPFYEETSNYPNLPFETVDPQDPLYLELLGLDWSVIDFSITKEDIDFDPVFCDSSGCLV